MPMLDLQLNGDNCWPELQETGFVAGDIIGIAGLPNGTAEGNPAVTIRVEVEINGKKQTVLAQTTLRLFLSAARALQAKYGYPM